MTHSTNESHASNPTGQEMVEQLANLDWVLSDSGLTPDAKEPLSQRRTDLHKQFGKAAIYATKLAEATGVEFPNPLTGQAAETAEPVKPFASAEVWGLMTPEQRQTAGEVREAMADRFKKYGVTAKDLRVVMTEAEKGERIFTLVHTGSGIDIGDPTNNYDPARSYPCVMSKKNDPLFIVTIDGKQYDTRKGMTSAVYDALYQDAIGRNATLPDSEQMSEDTKYKRTHTILTGESPSLAGLVLVRCVLGGKISRDVRGPNIDFRGLSVRPAAVIGIYLPHTLSEAA